MKNVLLLIFGIAVFIYGFFFAVNIYSDSNEESPTEVKILGNLDHLTRGKYPRQELFIIGTDIETGKTIDIEVSPSTYFNLSNNVGKIYTFDLSKSDRGLTYNIWGRNPGWVMLGGIVIIIIGALICIYACSLMEGEE